MSGERDSFDMTSSEEINNNNSNSNNNNNNNIDDDETNNNNTSNSNSNVNTPTAAAAAERAASPPSSPPHSPSSASTSIYPSNAIAGDISEGYEYVDAPQELDHEGLRHRSVHPDSSSPLSSLLNAAASTISAAAQAAASPSPITTLNNNNNNNNSNTATTASSSTTTTTTSGSKQQQKLALSLDPTINAFIKSLVEKSPPQLKPTIETLAPYIYKASAMVQASIPLIYALYLQCVKLKDFLCSDKYRFDLLIPSFIGLSMCFFGGTFVTVIAAAEAYRLVGYETTLMSIRDLHHDVTQFLEANKKDDSADADGNGVSDVAEMEPSQVITRKTLLFLKSVDPKRITNALSGINASFLAVVATLKVTFAKAITLGVSIANMLEKPANNTILPIVEAALPPDYRRWAKPLMDYAISSIAISIAWTLQRVISCIHSAARGGMMFSRNFIMYMNKMGYLQLNHEDTNIDEVLGYLMAFIGISFQLTRGFAVPFPMNLLLMPFSFLEWFLMRAVNA